MHAYSSHYTHSLIGVIPSCRSCYVLPFFCNSIKVRESDNYYDHSHNTGKIMMKAVILSLFLLLASALAKNPTGIHFIL